jgi:hypothetical protein
VVVEVLNKLQLLVQLVVLVVAVELIRQVAEQETLLQLILLKEMLVEVILQAVVVEVVEQHKQVLVVLVAELSVVQEHLMQLQEQKLHMLAEVVGDQIIDVHLVEQVELAVVVKVDLDQVVLVQEYLQVVQLIQVVEQVELEKAHQDNQMVVQVS